MATPSSILAWEIPWTEEPGGLQSMGSQASETTEQLSNNNSFSDYGGMNSCLIFGKQFANKGLYSQSYSHVHIWELDYKEGWAPKNWCFQIVVLKKTLESLLVSKQIKPVNPKGNQSWILIGRTDAEPKIQYFGYVMWRTDSLEKTLILGKTEGRRRRGQQKQKMRQVDGIINSVDMSLSKLWDIAEGQGSLTCCSPWGCKESDMTEWLNNKVGEKKKRKKRLK